MSRKKGIALSYVYTIMNTVIGLFMSAYIIQSVGQADYGIYQAVTAFVSYLVLFELGTGTILTRNISLLKKDGSETDQIQKNISTIWIISLLMSGIIVAVSIGFYFMMDGIYSNSLTADQIAFGKPLFILAVVKLVFNFLTQTMNGAIIGCEHYSVHRVISIVHLAFRTVVVAVALHFTHRVFIDAILSIVVGAATAFYCFFNLKIKLTVKNFDKTVFVAAMPLAMALLFQSIINMANNSVDKFVISVLMPPESVAVYSVAMYVYVTFSTLTTVPITMYMPQIAQNMRAGLRGTELTKTLVPACRLTVVIGGLIVAGFIAIGRPFVKFMYGAEYIEAWFTAVLIMVPMLVNMTNGVVVNVLDILNKRLARSLILMCTTVLNIILTVWWVQKYGMIGAAIATAISTIIGQIILSNLYYSKIIGLKVSLLFSQGYKGTLPSLIVAAISGWTITFIPSTSLVKLLVGGIVFLSVFAAMFWFFGANADEKQMLKSIFGRFVKP